MNGITDAFVAAFPHIINDIIKRSLCDTNILRMVKPRYDGNARGIQVSNKNSGRLDSETELYTFSKCK